MEDWEYEQECMMHGNHLLNCKQVSQGDIVRAIQLLLVRVGETESELVRLLGHQLIAISYGAQGANICNPMRVPHRPTALSSVRRAST